MWHLMIRVLKIRVGSSFMGMTTSGLNDWVLQLHVSLQAFITNLPATVLFKYLEA